jgi:hypothetical protein
MARTVDGGHQRCRRVTRMTSGGVKRYGVMYRVGESAPRYAGSFSRRRQATPLDLVPPDPSEPSVGIAR